MKEILTAIAAATGDVDRIPKGNKNVDQKYNFASIDDFNRMICPIVSTHGLVTLIDEIDRSFIEKPGKYGPTFWVSLTYSIITHHVSGQSMPPVIRHVEVLRNGPQAYGSAQSYVSKQYYRSLFCISTGEKDDPDFGEAPPQQQREPEPKRQPEPPSQEAIILAKGYLAEANNIDDLKRRWAGLPKNMQSADAVLAAKDATKNALNAPITDDEIPY